MKFLCWGEGLLVLSCHKFNTVKGYIYTHNIRLLFWSFCMRRIVVVEGGSSDSLQPCCFLETNILLLTSSVPKLHRTLTLNRHIPLDQVSSTPSAIHHIHKAPCSFLSELLRWKETRRPRPKSNARLSPLHQRASTTTSRHRMRQTTIASDSE